MEEEARQILTEAAVPRRLSGQMAVEHFKRLRAQMNGGDPFDLSPTLNAGFYNFVYLALALEAGAPLVTADERLIRAVRASPG
jgi:hypothetical protein